MEFDCFDVVLESLQLSHKLGFAFSKAETTPNGVKLAVAWPHQLWTFDELSRKCMGVCNLWMEIVSLLVNATA